MTRPRKTNRHLPAKMYFKHGRHWYVSGGKWRPLDPDFQKALGEYGSLVATPRGGMGELVDRVMLELRGRKKALAANTLAQYTLAAKRLKKAFVEFAPEQVRAKHVAAFKLQQAAHPNMANRMLSLLRTVFAYAVEWQLVDSNPCIGVKRLEEGKRDRYITDGEFQAIRAVAQPRLAAIMDLHYLTGQRIGDVLRIRRSDITEDGIYFEQQKTGNRLRVRMTPELAAAIERAKAVDGENVRGLTLFHIRGRVPSYKGVRDAFERARLLAGIEDARLNDTRAKSLTDADQQGKDPQKLGGHATRAMTERYIRQRRTVEADAPSFRQSIDSGKKKA